MVLSNALCAMWQWEEVGSGGGEEGWGRVGRGVGLPAQPVSSEHREGMLGEISLYFQEALPTFLHTLQHLHTGLCHLPYACRFLYTVCATLLSS